MTEKLKRRIYMIILGIIIAVVIVVNAPGLFTIFYKISYKPRIDQIPLFGLDSGGKMRGENGFTGEDRVLIIAPHPDDEVLACGGIIQQALKAKSSVCIVWITSGDGFEWDDIILTHDPIPGAERMLELGKRRMKEGREATALLGVIPENLYFLGFPDGGLSRLMLDHYDLPYTSKYTKESNVPYPDAYLPAVEYTGRNFETELSNIVNKLNPTMVFAPSIFDNHHDHKATGEVIIRVMGQRKEIHNLMTYIVHGGFEWPRPKGWHRTLPLLPAPRGKHLSWMKINLSEDEIKHKEEALRTYRSQMVVLGRFLEAFLRTNELVSNDIIKTTEPEEPVE